MKAKRKRAAQRRALRSRTPSDCLLTAGEVAYLTGTSLRMIRRLLDLELIVPAAAPLADCFPVDSVPRVRRILRLHRHLEVDLDSMSLVLELLDRIEELERLVLRMR
jgi:hypothetical protein